MSRGQSTQTFNTASKENAQNNQNAQNSFGAAQDDVGQYQNELAKFVSGNPYTAGGEFDRTINKGLTNTSDAEANSLKGALQSQATRTGQNSAADAATAASAAQQNTRDLSSALANAQQQRIGNEADYNKTALQASAEPEQMEEGLYGAAGGQANQELGTEEGAAQTPSFWDELGNGLASGIAGGISATPSAITGAGRGKCWIAAELYGGWYEPRTVLVRAWLNCEFCEHWYGRVTMFVYGLTGRPIAAALRRFPSLKPFFRLLFDAALYEAQKGRRANG